MKIHTKIFWFMTIHAKLCNDVKPLCIRFDKVDEFIIVYGGTRSIRTSITWS